MKTEEPINAPIDQEQRQRKPGLVSRMGSSQSVIPSGSSSIQPEDHPGDRSPPSRTSQCPIQHLDRQQPEANDDQLMANRDFNHLNNMPHLAQAPSPGQRTSLSLERTMSSIPRSPSIDATSPPSSSSSHGELATSSCPINHRDSDQKKKTWVYPSPQQFYNALLRKGWETPEEAIPVMVDIHNWMNEAVWGEVLRWESRYFFNHHTNSATSKLINPSEIRSDPTVHQSIQPEISLAKFQGRATDLSPKARFNWLLSKIFPNLYNPYKPFDRHDWLICRENPKNSSNPLEVDPPKFCRYVIDYYDGGVDEDGNPVFHFDVRPAIDDFDSLMARLKEWARVKNETWFKADQNTSPTNIVERD